MSLTQLQKPDLLAGSGDAFDIKLSNVEEKTPNKQKINRRLPVSACRKFNSRSPVRDLNKKLLAHELNKLINERDATPPRRTTPVKLTPRKRSLTMSDMTAAKHSVQKTRPIETELHQVEDKDSPTVEEEVRVLREKDGQRRAYGRLLLLVWRRRREQVDVCTESVKQLEQQVHQLQLQTSFLRNLRQNESNRRTEASVEAIKLKSDLDEVTAEYQKAKEEKEAYIATVRNFEVVMQKLQTDLENMRNNSILVEQENFELHSQLAKEREKMQKLRTERQCLKEQVATLESVINQKEVDMHKLRRVTEDVTEKLQSQVGQLHSTIKLQEEMTQKLNDAENQSNKLEDRLKTSLKNEKVLRSEISILQKTVYNLENDNFQFKLDNKELKTKLEKTELQLFALTNRSWWLLLKDFTSTPLDLLRKAAIITLPALPDDTAFRNLKLNIS